METWPNPWSPPAAPEDDPVVQAAQRELHEKVATLPGEVREVVDLHADMGKRVFVRLVDEGTSGWGHVNFDDFVFHDKAPVIPVLPPARLGRCPAARQ